MLKHAIEDETMIRTQTQDQYKHFKEGRTSTENNERSRRKRASKIEENIQEVRKLIRSNCCSTVPEVAEEGRIAQTNVS